MKFVVNKVSTSKYVEAKEFQSLEELMSWRDSLVTPNQTAPYDVIISRSEDGQPRVTIFDDYL